MSKNKRLATFALPVDKFAFLIFFLVCHIWCHEHGTVESSMEAIFSLSSKLNADRTMFERCLNWWKTIYVPTSRTSACVTWSWKHKYLQLLQSHVIWGWKLNKPDIFVFVQCEQSFSLRCDTILSRHPGKQPVKSSRAGSPDLVLKKGVGGGGVTLDMELYKQMISTCFLITQVDSEAQTCSRTNFSWCD